MTEKQIFKSSKGRDTILAAYDGVLKNWPVSFEELDLSTRLGSTHVLASGDRNAPALILLHGSSVNSSMWVGDVGAYVLYFRVYAVDIPGEPGKSTEARPELRSDAYALWLSDVLDELHVPRTDLLGISLGGWLALKFAAAYPDRVKKLVLLCPSGVAPQKPTFIPLALVLLPFGEWGRDRLIRIVNGRDDIPEEAIRMSKLIAANFKPRLEAIPLFSDAELAKLSMPTLLIVGEKDALLPSKKTAARLGKLLPQVRLEILTGVGHVLIGLRERILSFLIE